MAALPLFLSVVCLVQEREHDVQQMIRRVHDALATLAADHELIAVDNASRDGTVVALRELTGAGGIPNLQVYALSGAVDSDTAAWVGLENALGDFVAVVNPDLDDLAQLSRMLEAAVNGAEIVFGHNDHVPRRTLAYRVGNAAFGLLVHGSRDLGAPADLPRFRILSRRFVNLLLQYPQPAVAYRLLPATQRFPHATIHFRTAPSQEQTRHLGDSFERGVRLLFTSTRAPMRLVTTLSLAGACLNALYSLYVIAIFLFKRDVAPGWTTLSLQTSGMFFLLSLVLLILGEYVLQITQSASQGPPYHVAQEFTSVQMTRQARLNVESDANDPGAVRSR